MHPLDSIGLKIFIFEASRATYASGDASLKQKEADGSTTIRFKNGSYRFHDNYFGGEPYGGREVVFFEEKAVWMMAYYGLVHEGVPQKDVYAFLMQSLSNATVEMPYRGPALFERDGWRYQNVCNGDVNRFSGTEKIIRDDELVYEASYLGGYVDR